MQNNKKNKIIGFANGCYDLFHIGHLNLLKKCKEYCDYLVVGVNTDEYIKEYKNKTPIIPLEERIEIIKSIKYHIVNRYKIGKIWYKRDLCAYIATILYPFFDKITYFKRKCK